MPRGCRRRASTFAAIGAVAVLILGVGTAIAAPTSFPGPAYPSADCTPFADGGTLGLAPQQWRSSVGLPISVAGAPAAQRIVIAEFDETANVDAVNAVMLQCGLPTVSLPVDTNPWYPVSAAPGAEATLDATVVAGALPPNTSIVMANTAQASGWYGLLVTAADACGFDFSFDPRTTLSVLSKGATYPAGGCIISISYGSSEAQFDGTQAQTDADWMMSQLALQGVIVVVAAGDEGSGGCISAAGLNFGDAVTVGLSDVQVLNDVATVTTTTPHGFVAGDIAYVTMTLAGTSHQLSDMFTVTGVTTSTFTFALVAPDLASTAVTGLASVDPGGLVPEWISTNPNSLAVGGTQWDTQGTSLTDGAYYPYTPGATLSENTWKDSSFNPNCSNLSTFTNGGEGTGGGQSLVYPMPSYQATAAARNYSSILTNRMVPDLAALSGWPLYAIANWGIAVTQVVVTSNVATLTTSVPGGFSVGESVAVDGVGAPFDGTVTVTAVAGSTFSFAVVAPDMQTTAVSPTGTALQTCASYPCDPALFPWVPVSGTSAATPLVAVGIASINASLSARSLPIIDNGGGAMDIHSIVYNPAYASAFTDVTAGDNDIHVLGGWSALAGYDMVTGMGVPNFGVLAGLLSAESPPAPTPTPSPSPSVPVPSPSPTPTPAPVVVAPPNPPAAFSPASGVIVVSEAAAERAEPRTMLREPTRRPSNAPTVAADRGAAVALVTSGLTPGADQVVRIKIDGKFVTLGTTRADADGLARLPVLRLLDRGTYVVSITDRETGRVVFLKIRVQSARS